MDNRGVSEVLSYTLVFTLIVSSVAVVSVSGLGGLQSARTAEQLQNSERAYDVLSNNIQDITSRGAPTRATEIKLEQSQMYVGDPVTIEVRLIDDGGSDTVRTWDTRPLILEASRDRRLIYEAGMTVRSNRDATFVVEEPEYTFRDSPSGNERVMIPIIDITTPGATSRSGSTILVRTTEQGREIVASDQGTYERVEITVTSPRRDAWGSYFEDEGFSCTEHPGQQIQCTYEGSGSSDSLEHLFVVRHEIRMELQD